MMNTTRTYQVVTYNSQGNMVMEMFQQTKSQGLLQLLNLVSWPPPDGVENAKKE